MNDTTETLSAAPVDDVRARNKAIVFAALTEARHSTASPSITTVPGDSGQIENV